MGRIGRGWALAKQSWAVVRADRSLLWFPVVSAVCAVLVLAIFFAIGAGVVAAAGTPWAALLPLIVGAYVLIVIGQFCAVALAACANIALDGGTTTFGDGIAAARGRFGLILQWSLVQLVVSSLITGLQALLREGAGSLVGNLVGGLANFAWTVATFFVVPVITLEGLGPRDAIKKSSHVIKERWGEGVVGSASIGGAVFLLGMLPAIALIAGGLALANSVAALGAILIALGVIVLVVASLIQATLSAVFRVALYRFATGGAAPAAFSHDQLEGAFRPKKSRGRGLLGGA